MKVSRGTKVSLVYTAGSNDGISPSGMSLYQIGSPYEGAPCDSASFSLTGQRCKKKQLLMREGEALKK
jgi:hypothetical protein